MSLPFAIPDGFFGNDNSEQAGVEINHGGQNPFSDINLMSETTTSYQNQRNYPSFNKGKGKEIDRDIDDLVSQLSVDQKRNNTRTRTRASHKGGHVFESESTLSDMTGYELMKLSESIRTLAEGQSVNEGRIKDRSRERQDWSPGQEEKYVTLKDFTEFARTIQGGSVLPSDSASQMRNNDEVTQRQPTRIQQKKLSEIQEVDSEIEETVVGGYQLSAEEKILEIDSYLDMPQIRGLPVIFQNSRLNYLTHIHDALFKILTYDGDQYPNPDCLDILMRNRDDWGETPSTSLLLLVMERTFDVRKGVVKSNPFRFPILEPGMILTPKLMHISLDQLHKEFELEWFNTMKTVTTPRFQSKYEDRKYKQIKQNKHRHSSSSSGSQTRSSESKHSSRRGRSGGSQSILGSIFGP